MLTDAAIKEIIITQRETIIQKKYGVERDVLRILESKIRLPHVVVITGLRRSGKSTLLRQLIKRYDDKDFYYLNFEDERLFNFPASEFNRLYEAMIGLYGKKKIFCVDEIQNVPHFETFIRRLYEEGNKFFITGSSASLLSKELGTRLTGRHVDIIVKPFSFKEFLAFKGIKANKESAYLVEKKVEIRKYFDEYLLRGGMPEYVTYNDPEILTRVYDDILLKDIASRYNVKNVAILRQLYSHLISNTANKFSYNSLKKLIDINSVNTIKKFIYYLEETYFAKTINKFDYSPRRQIINDKKCYIIDNGFITLLSKKLTKDNGWLLENLVFNSIAGDVFYHAEKKECDFLIVRNKQVQEAIQVCYELTDDNKERELLGLKEAMEKFNIKEGLILTNNQEDDIIIHERKILIRPVWKWVLER